MLINSTKINAFFLLYVSYPGPKNRSPLKCIIWSGTSISQTSVSKAMLFECFLNGLQLPEGGDFEALHCQPSTNFDGSTKLD